VTQNNSKEEEEEEEEGGGGGGMLLEFEGNTVKRSHLSLPVVLYKPWSEARLKGP